MTDHFIDPQAFLAFAQSKPPTERYVYNSCYECALAQFGQQQHPDAPLIIAGSVRYNVIQGPGQGEPYYLPDFLVADQYLLFTNAVNERETYETWGALAARLQAHMEAHNAPA